MASLLLMLLSLLPAVTLILLSFSAGLNSYLSIKYLIENLLHF